MILNVENTIHSQQVPLPVIKLINNLQVFYVKEETAWWVCFAILLVNWRPLLDSYLFGYSLHSS